MVLAVLLLAGTAAIHPAKAAEAVYASTRAALAYLDQEGIKYTLKDVDSDGDERVDVSYSLDNFDSATVHLYFSEDGEKVSLRIWDVVKPTAGKNYVLNTVNKLNCGYKWSKFTYDESDSTISMEMDMYIDAASCGAPVRKAIRIMILELDDDTISAELKALE